MGLGAVYNSLDPKMKGVVVLTVMGLVVAGGIYGGVKLKQLAENSSNRKEDREWGKDLKETAKDPATAQTLTKAESFSIANSIFASIDGCGTYENEILGELIKLRTDGDFAAVQDAYGTKTATCWGSGSPMSLTPALKNELSPYWINLINKELSASGISYTL